MRAALVGCLLVLWASPAWPLSVKGNLIDAQDAPVPNASVWLVQDRDVHRVISDAKGAFQFEKLPVGEIQVLALKEGLALGGFTGFLVSDLSDLRIPLREADTLTLRIINQDFFPVAGARLRWITVLDGFSIPVELLSEQGFPAPRSGEDGVLTFPQLPKGAGVQVIAAHFSYAETFAAYLPIGGKRQDILLHQGFKLSGRVTDGKDPVPNAQVSVYRTGTRGDYVCASSLSDPEGYYSVRVLSGEYQVRVRHPKYASPEPAPVTVRKDSDETVADLALLAPRTIEGLLQFPEKKPAPGVQVVFRVGKTVTADACTDTEGRFRLLVGVPEGILHIVPPPGFMTETLADIPVRLGDKNKASLDMVRLLELPRVTGTIKMPGGEAPGRLLLSSLDLPVPLWAISDEQGHFDVRLGYAPDKDTIHFRIEHASQLLRKDFELDIKHPAPADLVLEAFSPTPAPPLDATGNNLLSILGKPAPEIKCSDWFNTQALTLAGLKGKVVVLFFWAGFDSSPRGMAAVEEMRAIYDLLGSAEDVAFLGIHDETSEADEVEEFVHQRNVRFPVGRDAEPSVTFNNYLVNALPQIVLLDKEGMPRQFQTDGRLLELITVLRNAVPKT